ncbi:MAG: bifunctional DNA-binding transcriptional regulator/O6-methylguanine-DNA methyltransferase Ada [Thermomicrobiales bacterium]
MTIDTFPIASLTDADRWQAILERDSTADGQFIMCVHTTGIYCRPACPARRPLRTNVHFVDSPMAARREGFRPCKRCLPDDALSPAARRVEIVASICRKIDASEESLSLDDLAAEAGMSRFHFHRVFREVTGVTPKAYETALRSSRMRTGLASGTTVTEAIYDAGFASNGRFYASTNETLGMTPGTFRRGGADMTIRWAFGESSLGKVLVAATDVGICSIMLGDDVAALQDELVQRFPRATMIDGDEYFASTVAAAVGCIEEPGRSDQLPLDIRGTAFQQRVWQALRAVPRGSTVSYGELADRIGSPGAARAVASACSQNKIAVAIPCHRAVGKDGALTGYRWGIERKRALLQRESTI